MTNFTITNYEMTMKNIFTLLLITITLLGQAQSNIPQKESGNKFSITCANLYFQIDSTNGARITSFKIDGNELMYVNFSGGNDMAGSTFWPSPQSIWNWPPPVNLDGRPYKTAIKGNKISFAGQTDTKTNLRFYKTMYANATDTSIVIEYTIKNEKAAAQTWAPWEITRVVGKGLTVFAEGEGSITGDMKSRTEELDGYGWYDQDATTGGKGNKIFCDGQGWLAHVVDGNMLFIKKFVDIPKANAAPGEAEVEVYTAPGNVYTELEDQGAYVSIASKDSITWKVKWFARNLPASVDVSVGSASLTGYIESVLKRSTDPAAKNDIPVYCSVKVFPNPATDFVVVETNLDSYNNISLWVYDLQGRIILKKSVGQNQQQVDVKTIAGGNYIYELKQNTTSIARGLLSVKR
jgi:hypothetical protein